MKDSHKLNKLIHREEEGLDLKSEWTLCTMVHLPQNETLIHQKAWESGAK